MLYRNGRYSVDVGQDGVIKVRPGDWLSKYSAAIFNNFWRVHEFGRMGRLGMEPIRNINLIYAGETVYHLPTYSKYRPSGLRAPAPSTPSISDSQKKEIMKSFLANEFHLRGDHLGLLGKIIDAQGYLDNAASLAEVAGLIGESAAASTVMGASAGLAAFLFPFGGILQMLNAWEEGQRIAGIASVGYSTTAWVFNDPVPGLPPRVQSLILNSGSANQLPAYQRAWKDASNATLSGLAQMVAKKAGKSKGDFQILFRALGEGNRKTVCSLIFKGFEKNLSNPSRIVLETYEYPN